MSDRHSFVTEFVYCRADGQAVVNACAERAAEDDRDAWCDVRGDHAIVAGYLRTLHIYWRMAFEQELADRLEGRLCHPVRFAVLGEDGGSGVCTVGPGGYTWDEEG